MDSNSLSPAVITDNLETRLIGQRVIYYPQLASTMDMARQEALKGAVEGTVIITDEQTAGRGRMKRAWLSPQGSIALSIIVYPAIAYLPYLTMVASLATVRTIEAMTGLKAQIKWPNDVLINGRKACGILIESKVSRNKVLYAVIGIGINANFRPADFSAIPMTATSLADELGKETSRVNIIRHLLVETERLYLALSNREAVYQEWRDRLVTLGRRVQVQSAKTILSGIAESVAHDGTLLLRHSNGSLTEVVAGDVSLRDE